MKPEIVFAAYRPHKGKEKQLEKLIAEHIPTLRKLDLVTDRASVLVKSKNGTYIEIFEWRSSEAAGKAHEHPAVARLWEAMELVADFVSLDSLEESKRQFSHFLPIAL